MANIRIAVASPQAGDVFWMRPGGEALIDVRGTARIEGVPSGNIRWIDSVSVQMGSGQPWLRASGDFSWSRQGRVTTPGDPTTISVRAQGFHRPKDREPNGEAGFNGSAPPLNVSVRLDETPPQLTVNPIGDNGRVYGPGPLVTVTVSGTASDSQSGVGWVECLVDGATPVRATPSPSWPNWTASLQIPLGGHTLTIRAADGVGNATTEVRTVEAIEPLVVDLPKERVTKAFVDLSARVNLDVPRVEWSLDNGPFSGAERTGVPTPGSPGYRWEARIPLPSRIVPKEGDPHSLTVRAVASSGSTEQRTVNFLAIDGTKPRLEVSYPAEGTLISSRDEATTVVLTGTATDDFGTGDLYSGLEMAEWSLDGTEFAPAVPRAPGDWSGWSATVSVRAYGEHKLRMLCRDNQGNAEVVERRFWTMSPFEVKDLSRRSYLKDLLDYATNHLLQADDTKVDEKRLAKAFHQPFAGLISASGNIATQQVRQSRVCVEVLRDYLDPQPAVSEAAYRRAAYLMLLNGLGTSYEEIRLARVSEDRSLLADRLGLELRFNRPDQLDRLFLEPDKVTEADLEGIFGLAATTRDPVDPVVLPEPELLFWRRDRLRATWTNQDHPSQPDSDAPPVLDPDLVRQEDLRNPLEGDAAFDLWNSRRQWTADQLANLRSKAKPESTAGFDQFVKEILGAVDLQNLADRRKEGIDIGTDLGKIPLDLAAFDYLMRIRKLAEVGTVLDSEWEDVYSILVQVIKRREYETWHGEERARRLVLSPDYFEVDEDAAPDEPPAWRATERARQDWGRKLRTRSDQLRSVEESLSEAVGAAEEAALPLLRDALIAAAGGGRTDVDVAEALSRRLLIDFKGAGTLKTTRLDQTLGTLQGLLFALRTGRFEEDGSGLDPDPIAGWKLLYESESTPNAGYTEERFDREMAWMGTYEAWRAAMFAFLYPENVLLPTLREERTEAFGTLLQELRKLPGLTPERARKQAEIYLKNLVEKTGLVEATKNNASSMLSNGSWETVELTDSFSERQLIERKGLVEKVTTAYKDYPRSVSAARWDFDEGSGATAADSSGNGHAATLEGPTWVIGRDGGKALEFDGVNDHVVAAKPDTLVMTDALTISAWIYPKGPGSSPAEGGIIVNKEGEYEAARFSDGTIQWAFANTRPGWNWVNTGHVAPADEWTHVAIAYDKGTVRTYANGRLVHTHLGEGLIGDVDNERNEFRIGGRQGGDSQHFRGLIDRVEIFNQALSQFKVNLASGEAPKYLQEIFYFVPVQLALQLERSGQYLAALDWLQIVYAYNLPTERRKIYEPLGLDPSDPGPPLRDNMRWLEQLNPHQIAKARANAYARFTLTVLARCFLGYADTEFGRDTDESLGRARSLYDRALRLLGSPEMDDTTDESNPAAHGFPPNPIPWALRLRAELNLFKLRAGRNVAGMERQAEPAAAAEQTASDGDDEGGLPAISPDGRPVTPGRAPLRPTSYYYSVLIERAKQLVEIARQVEASYFSALERIDAENYSLLQAGHDLQLAEATVDLQKLRVAEATAGEDLAKSQKTRALTLFTEYQQVINAGFNEYEDRLLQDYENIQRAQDTLANSEWLLTTAQSIVNAATATLTAPAAFAAVGVVSYIAGIRTYATQQVNKAQHDAQVNQLWASWERRREDLTLQKKAADQDAQIAQEQIDMAVAHSSVVVGEQQIAQTQSAQARAVADFLANKFTNAELYEWMSGVLGEVYAYFLNQATAVAKLAENQLAFERQEVPPSFIQVDYWEPASDAAAVAGGTTGAAEGEESERRGLTGSARLLQDLYRLDQHAFETNKRKLQLSHTISLARMAPFEFQRFRETGVMRFTTPMEIFDRAFPGHYLRLIRRTRTSMVALIPPNQGIKATLSALGVSRVVVGGDVFQKVVVRRNPETVALCSPTNATGLFELDPQPEMLLPFEAMGVDTSWEFRLPKPANHFDYGTIADVLITLEYTALNSLDYAYQVIQGLDRSVEAERSFSLKRDFPDEWYALHNPEGSSAPMAVSFETTREDFPPNLEDPIISQVVLYVVPSDGKPFANPLKVDLRFSPLGGNEAGGETISQEGVFSTRRGNAASWTQNITGRPANGRWTLKLSDTQETKQLFEEGKIEDVLLVITYSGTTPAWPA